MQLIINSLPYERPKLRTAATALLTVAVLFFAGLVYVDAWSVDLDAVETTEQQRYAAAEGWKQIAFFDPVDGADYFTPEEQ